MLRLRRFGTHPRPRPATHKRTIVLGGPAGVRVGPRNHEES